MKRVILLILITLIVLPVAAHAQKRKTPARKTTVTSTGKAGSLPIVRESAQRLAEHIKTLTKFLFLLGGVSKGIESADAAIQAGETSSTIVEQTQRSKLTVRNSIMSLREQLDQVELDFRLKPELQPYYTKLAGVANGAATAEDEAAAGQFDKAGRTLLTVVNRLADVLVEMR